ncbi:MAG: heme exporter protein CcmD [Pseudomonadota bacterium]
MIAWLTEDPHAPYVLTAYGATAAVLGALILFSLRANARARREVAEAEREAGRQ